MFSVKYVEGKASAAKDLCGWCLAMKTYSEVSKKVGPKKIMVKELEQKLSSARSILDTKLSDLNQGTTIYNNNNINNIDNNIINDYINDKSNKTWRS
jgi:hypothetical protein